MSAVIDMRRPLRHGGVPKLLREVGSNRRFFLPRKEKSTQKSIAGRYSVYLAAGVTIGWLVILGRMQVQSTARLWQPLVGLGKRAFYPSFFNFPKFYEVSHD